MIMEVLDRTIIVAMPEWVVSAMLQMNALLAAGLAVSLQSLMVGSEIEFVKQATEPNTKAFLTSNAGKYSVKFLGLHFTARTLPGLFAKVVDLTADVAPEALDTLATKRASKKRLVSRDRDALILLS